MTLLLNASNAYLSGTIDLTDTPQLLLTNSSTYTVASALSAVTAEEVSGNGYTRPTLTVQNNSISPGGDSTLIYNLATITATGGAITFDRVVLIADGDWVGYWDYGSEQTIADGTTKPFRGITVTRSDSGTLINGQNGSPAWSVTTATFTHPASVGGTVSVSVADTSWMAKGQSIFFSDETNSGNYKITAIGSATSVTVERLDSLTVGGTVMQVGKFVCSGLTGTTGIAGFGLRFTHSSTTTSPPGSGELRFNHASPGSATAIYIDAEDRNSVDVSAIVAGLNAGSSLLVIDENDSAVWALFILTSVTDNTTNLTLAVTAIGATGTFAGDILLTFANKGNTGNNGTNGSDGTDGLGWTGGSYNAGTGIVTFTSDDGLGFATGDLRGSDGANGITGFGLKFTHSSTTTSPPGSGELRFNHASPGSATAIYIDAEDRNSVDVSAIVAGLNAGSSLLVIDENDSAVWALFILTSVTDNGTNLTLAVTAIGAIGSFSGNVSLTFANKGNTGATVATNEWANGDYSIKFQAPTIAADYTYTLPVDYGADGYVLKTNGAGVLTWGGQQFGRETLTANRTYYVRTDGSDSNTGLANTSGAAFLTLAKAVSVAASLDWSIYDVVISLAAGTYTLSSTINLIRGLGGKKLTITGGTGTSADVVISASGFSIFTGTFLSDVTIKDLTLQSLDPGSAYINGCYFESSSVLFQNIIFNGSGQSINVFSVGGIIFVNGATFTGNFYVGISGAHGAQIIFTTLSSISVSGASFSYRSIQLENAGCRFFDMTITGTVTVALTSYSWLVQKTGKTVTASPVDDSVVKTL